MQKLRTGEECVKALHNIYNDMGVISDMLGYNKGYLYRVKGGHCKMGRYATRMLNWVVNDILEQHENNRRLYRIYGDTDTEATTDFEP